MLRFRHGLVREAAYASLAKSARARLHERHAAWLDRPRRRAARGRRPDRVPPRDRLPLRSGSSTGERASPRCRAERATGSRRPRRWRAAAATCWARSASSIAPSRCSARRPQQGAALLPMLAVGALRGGRLRACRGARAIARWPASAALGLAGVGARAAIERERIRLYRHPETFDVAGRERASWSARRARSRARGRRARAGAGGVPDVRSHVAAGRPGGAPTRTRSAMLAPRAPRRQRRSTSATALIFMAWCLVEGPWPAPEAIARCDALARRGGRAARRRAQPARLPGGALGDDRPLRRGARRDGGGARAASPSCSWA